MKHIQNFNGYTVKGIKSFVGMEGLGFNATLYKDGRKIAFCIDEGCGGDVIFQFVNRDGKDEKTLRDYCDTLPRVKCKGVPEGLKMDMGWFITALVDQCEKDQKFKRQCKTHTLFRLTDDKEGQYWTLKAVYSPTVREHLQKKHGDKLVEIINERFVCQPRL